MIVLDALPVMNSRVSEFNTFYIFANVCSTPREDLKKFLCLAQEVASLLAVRIRLNVTRIFQHMWVNIYTHFKQIFQFLVVFQ